MKMKKNKEVKCPRYKTMKCYDKIKCPHYEGDGYMYKFNRIEFNLCDKCNETLLNQMLDQFKIEQECRIVGTKRKGVAKSEPKEDSTRKQCENNLKGDYS